MEPTCDELRAVANAPPTPCECPVAGFCQRHGITKFERWHHLCRTRRDYFDLYEAGRGPGQNPGVARQAAPDPSAPGILKKMWNVATSLAAFVADGCTTVTTEQYEARLKICDGCQWRSNNSCRKCGCNLALKAHGRAFKCPIGKWPEIPS
ncbi:MAG TPA: DUF6171 family protein [Planctomycetaceae bacterium]|jgi:hypothetical protein